MAVPACLTGGQLVPVQQAPPFVRVGFSKQVPRLVGLLVRPCRPRRDLPQVLGQGHGSPVFREGVGARQGDGEIGRKELEDGVGLSEVSKLLIATGEAGVVVVVVAIAAIATIVVVPCLPENRALRGRDHQRARKQGGESSLCPILLKKFIHGCSINRARVMVLGDPRRRRSRTPCSSADRIRQLLVGGTIGTIRTALPSASGGVIGAVDVVGVDQKCRNQTVLDHPSQKCKKDDVNQQ